MSRNIISISTIRRLASANNRLKREAYSNYLRSLDDKDAKSISPYYELENIDFNEETRIAKIVFLEIKTYRTIERYITRNYVKYPIYSEWKSKTKKINKSIKLTNSELESLNKHNDILIRNHAEEIIMNLDNEKLFPSWFILSTLKQEYEKKCKEIKSALKNFQTQKQYRIEQIDKEFCNNLSFIDQRTIKREFYSKKRQKIATKIANINKAKKSFLISIITFGIYYYYTSKKRLAKLSKKLGTIDTEIQTIQDEINTLERQNIKLLSEKDSIKNLLNEKSQDAIFFLSKAKESYNTKTCMVTPLETEYKNKDSFILLKDVGGLEYRKIVGCYIIRNREKNKYYVGQSKDVIKRLKQHFKGTVPHNIIFAEDYYSSQNKEDLFEVKIIPCNTKDELDKTEKTLIEQYDSWLSGYNGTSGNN